MANKCKSVKKQKSREIKAVSKSEEDKAVTIARTVLDPIVQAAVTLKEYSKAFGDLDLVGLIDSLAEQARESKNGDLSRAEAMLTTQAHTLDAIFNRLAHRASLNMGEYMQASETYLKLALRAQSQCRATWEALANIKNPPMMGYVRQANIAHGPQQVNNASPPPNTSPTTKENTKPKNKLLEENDGERLDPRTACTSGRTDPEMATVGKVHRPKNQGR